MNIRETEGRLIIYINALPSTVLSVGSTFIRTLRRVKVNHTKWKGGEETESERQENGCLRRRAEWSSKRRRRGTIRAMAREGISSQPPSIDVRDPGRDRCGRSTDEKPILTSRTPFPSSSTRAVGIYYGGISNQNTTMNYWMREK